MVSVFSFFVHIETVTFAIFELLHVFLMFLDIAMVIFDRFPIVEPDTGHTKLRLSREGLEAIEKITTPIAAVAVSFALISWFLNQNKTIM